MGVAESKGTLALARHVTIMLGSIGNTASTWWWRAGVLPYLWLQLAGCRCGPGPGGVVEVVEVEVVEVTRAR